MRGRAVTEGEAEEMRAHLTRMALRLVVAVNDATDRGATGIQATAFNGCCAVYAPRYRQANGMAFTRSSADGDRAIDVACGDVRVAAFVSASAERPR